MEKQTVISIVIGVAAFLGGFVLRGIWPDAPRDSGVREDAVSDTVTVRDGYLAAGEEGIPAVRVRMNDGDVEWYDGTRWNFVATAEELEKADPFSMTSDAWEALEERLAETAREERQTALASLSREEARLLIGEKERSKPDAAKPPAAIQPRPEQPPVPAQPQTPSVQGNGGSSDDDSSGGDSSGDDSSGGGAPDNGSSGGDSSGGQDDPPAENPDTGDGEDMEWSDDYL